MIDQSWMCQGELQDIDCLQGLFFFNMGRCLWWLWFIFMCKHARSSHQDSEHCTTWLNVGAGRVLVFTAIKFTWLTAAMRVRCSFLIYPDYTIEHESRLEDPRVPSLHLSVSSHIWISEELIIFCLPHICSPSSSFAGSMYHTFGAER